LTRLAQQLWFYALRGVAAILFSIAAFGWRHPTLAVLIVLFGAYTLDRWDLPRSQALAGWSQIEDPWLENGEPKPRHTSVGTVNIRAA